MADERAGERRTPEPSRWRHFQLKLIELVVLGIPIGVAANLGVQHWVAERNRLELQIERESREAMAEREMWKDAAAKLDSVVMPMQEARVQAFIRAAHAYIRSEVPLSEVEEFSELLDAPRVLSVEEMRVDQALREIRQMAQHYRRPHLAAAALWLHDSAEAFDEMRIDDFVDIDVAFRPLLMDELALMLRDEGLDLFAPDGTDEAERVVAYLESDPQIIPTIMEQLLPMFRGDSEIGRKLQPFAEDYQRVKVMLLCPRLGAMDKAYIDPSTSPELADMDERIRAAEELLERVTARTAEEAAANDGSGEP